MRKRIIAFFCIINFIFGFCFVFATENLDPIDLDNNIIESENLINNEEINEQEEYTQVLDLHSEGAVLIEMDSGEVLYDKNMKERLYPASITKILTAILTIENCDDLSEKAKASEYAVNSIPDGYTTAGIKVGEEFTIEELLEVMMLRSANEAATILAEYVSGSLDEFAKLMNSKAKEIGCLDSNFVNANGMHNENHYSTTYDMALIERYCMQNEEFRRISALTSCSLPNTEFYDGEPRTFSNTHGFLIKDNPNYYKYAIAGKTGFTTPAKNCLVTCTNKKGFELIAVVLHAEGNIDGVSARYYDTKQLLDYGYKNYRISEFLKKGSIVDSIEIETEDGKKEKINLVLGDDIRILCKKDDVISKTSGDIKLEDITLPIEKGDELGTITYSINNKEYSVPILSDDSIVLTSKVKQVTLDTQKEFDYYAIVILFGLILMAILVVIAFIIVVRKEKKEKLNFG